MSKHTDESLQLVQEKLLSELALVLSGDTAYTFASVPSFTLRRKASEAGGHRAASSNASHVLLALETLQRFELHEVDLFDFVRRCVLPYIHHENKVICSTAGVVACKLLLPAGNTKHTATFQEEYRVIQDLVTVALSDLRFEVRVQLLDALDSRYDPYLIQVSVAGGRQASRRSWASCSWRCETSSTRCSGPRCASCSAWRRSSRAW